MVYNLVTGGDRIGRTPGLERGSDMTFQKASERAWTLSLDKKGLRDYVGILWLDGSWAVCEDVFGGFGYYIHNAWGEGNAHGKLHTVYQGGCVFEQPALHWA